MKYLVGDIGNTLTKFSLLNENFKIIKNFSIETKKIKKNKNCDFLFKNLLKKDLNNNILFSSVVPLIFNKIKLAFKKRKLKVIEIKDLNLKKLIKFRINKINQIGSDRIANAIGSFNKYKTNCLIIDFGTATTFDIVKKPGVYEGGVITPGINLSIINLKQSTALLPKIDLKSDSKCYGKNTKDAINAGFIWGYQGLINNIINKISLTSKTNYKIILTGGYANLFKKYICCNPKIDQHITIKGIIKIYKKLII